MVMGACTGGWSVGLTGWHWRGSRMGPPPFLGYTTDACCHAWAYIDGVIRPTGDLLSLAYVWIHAAAGFAQAHGWVEQFHRTDRCDLGLFQIGLRAIQYALREGLRVPVSFLLPLDSP